MILWTSRITQPYTSTWQGILLLFIIINNIIMVNMVIIIMIVMMDREGEDESEVPKSSLKAKQQIFLCR